jgi:hypothetical protein
MLLVFDTQGGGRIEFAAYQFFCDNSILLKFSVQASLKVQG